MQLLEGIPLRVYRELSAIQTLTEGLAMLSASANGFGCCQSLKNSGTIKNIKLGLMIQCNIIT